MEIGDPIDFVVCLSCAIAKVCDYASGAKDAHPGGTGKKQWCKFFILAITKLVSNTSITVFLCCLHLFECN